MEDVCGDEREREVVDLTILLGGVGGRGGGGVFGEV